MKKSILLMFLFLLSLSANDNFYAFKTGIFSHNSGILNNSKDSYITIHSELLFKKKYLKAYPTIGAELNLNGHSSFLYSGLSWEKVYMEKLLFGIFLGASIHNGNIDNKNSSKRKLGTRLLFREAINIGYYINQNYTISFLANHYSNGGLGGIYNQGVSNIGFRLSYYF